MINKKNISILFLAILMATLIIPLPLTLNAAGNCGNSYSEDDSGVV